jgi:hypothetical protein
MKTIIVAALVSLLAACSAIGNAALLGGLQGAAEGYQESLSK